MYEREWRGFVWLVVLLALMFVAIAARAAEPQVWNCPEAGADGRSLDAWTASCLTSTYVPASQASVVASNAASAAPPGPVQWLAVAKLPHDGRVWTDDSKWTDYSALTWVAPAPPVIAPPAAGAGTATLDWVPPTTNTDGTAITNLAGYRIYYGTTSGSLSQVVDITNPALTHWVLTGLPAGTYYFTIIAINSAGAESQPSAQASKVIASAPPPPVDCVVSAWSTWASTSPWSACTAGQQTQTELRTRTVITPAANGGAACPTLTDLQTITQACQMPVVWAVKKNGTQATRPVYWRIRNATDTGYDVGPQLGTVAIGKPCDAAGARAASDEYHAVAEADVKLASVSYRGLPLISVCAKQ